MKAILFDVDDTLYDQTWPFMKAYEQLYGEKYNLNMNRLFSRSRHYSDEVYTPALEGEITMEQMYIYRVQKAFADFDIFVSDEEALEFQRIYAYYQNHIEMSEQMEQLIEELSHSVMLGIITNGPSEHQWNKVKNLGLSRWMKEEYIIVSEDVGYTKPEHGIFDIAEKRMKLPAEELLFVGDAYINDITGAKEAGWKAIWMNRRENKLPEEGIQPDYEVTTEEKLIELLKSLIKHI